MACNTVTIAAEASTSLAAMTDFSFRARLVIEILAITELSTKAADCYAKVFVNNVKQKTGPVSYTHLTLPAKRIV